MKIPFLRIALAALVLAGLREQCLAGDEVFLPRTLLQGDETSGVDIEITVGSYRYGPNRSAHMYSFAFWNRTNETWHGSAAVEITTDGKSKVVNKGVELKPGKTGFSDSEIVDSVRLIGLTPSTSRNSSPYGPTIGNMQVFPGTKSPKPTAKP